MGRIKNWKKIGKGMWKYGHQDLDLYVMIDRDFEAHVPVVSDKKHRVEITGLSYPTFEEARKVAVQFMKKYKDPAKLDGWFDEKSSWQSGWD